jgi:hypothetical protein
VLILGAYAYTILPVRVTVVHNGQVWRGHVSTRRRHATYVVIETPYPMAIPDSVVTVKVTRGAYGITWCYGWEGRAARALRAYRGLTS